MDIAPVCPSVRHRRSLKSVSGEGLKERDKDPENHLSMFVNNKRENSKFTFSSQQSVKQHINGQREQTLPSRPENRLFRLSSIFKTSFLDLMTGCGKKEKIKREDPMDTVKAVSALRSECPLSAAPSHQ